MQEGDRRQDLLKHAIEFPILSVFAVVFRGIDRKRRFLLRTLQGGGRTTKAGRFGDGWHQTRPHELLVTSPFILPQSLF